MTQFTSDTLAGLILSDLPFPNTIEKVDFETVLAALKADLIADFPDAADVIDNETDPLVILLERMAHEIVKIRQWGNDAARQNTLAHGYGTALDNFAAFWGMARKIIDAGNPNAIPPLPPTHEADDDFRARIQLAPEGISVAGPAGAYRFHANSVDGVKDSRAVRGDPGEVILYVMAAVGDGTANTALLTRVSQYLQPRRPLCSTLIMRSVSVQNYDLTAEITLLPSYDADEVLAEAQASAAAFVAAQHALEHDVTIAGLHAALFQRGVQNVTITSPSADIVCGAGEAAFCTAVTITAGGYDV